MIKNRSPYYIDTPFVSPLTGLTSTKYILKIYVWSGEKSAVPSEPSYQFTKNNVTAGVGSDSVNISRVIKDYLNFVPQKGILTSLIKGNNQMWVKSVAFYTTSNTGELNTPQNISVDLMVNGYAYGIEGRNQSVQSNKVLLDGTDFNVNRNGFFVLPIEIDQPTPPAASITIISSVLDGLVYDTAFSSVGTYTEFVVISKESGVVTSTQIIGTTSPRDILPWAGITDPLITSVDIKFTGYDLGTGTTITSNTLTITR